VHVPSGLPSGKASKQARGAHLLSGVQGLATHGEVDHSALDTGNGSKTPSVKVLFIGDIVGSPGRKVVQERLLDILAQRHIDFCIVNCENAASGFGVTPRIAEELFQSGADVLTSGNHIWKRKEIIDYFPGEPRLLRPANFPSGSPGRGLYVGSAKNGVRSAVLNLQGRTYMAPIDDPFRTAERELSHIPPDVKVIVVDMHAEATSEKVAIGLYLDGRVSAVLGTHTHVATADERVLAGGTAYITDVGMTGPHDSVIGMEKEGILRHFLDAMPSRFVVAEGDVQMNTVLIDVDESTGHARSIERLKFRLD
jgi:2',3'-cyclic-nucleotide 2'-phosphodiesterase